VRIRTVTKSTPVLRNGIPNVKRSTPYWASVPIVPRNTPAKRETRAAGIDDWPSWLFPLRRRRQTVEPRGVVAEDLALDVLRQVLALGQDLHRPRGQRVPVRVVGRVHDLRVAEQLHGHGQRLLVRVAGKDEPRVLG